MRSSVTTQVSTVFVDCESMYTSGAADGTSGSLGETEFAQGCAAMAASGNWGSTRVAAGIISAVGSPENPRGLDLGAEAVEKALRAHMAAGKNFRGVRTFSFALWPADPSIEDLDPLVCRLTPTPPLTRSAVLWLLCNQQHRCNYRRTTLRSLKALQWWPSWSWFWRSIVAKTCKRSIGSCG